MTQLNAAKRITAATTDDAGMALQFLEGIFGKGKKDKQSANGTGAGVIEWNGKNWTARLELSANDKKADSLEFFYSRWNDSNFGIVEFVVHAKNFERFKKEMARQVKSARKELDLDLRDAEKAVTDINESLSVLDKLSK